MHRIFGLLVLMLASTSHQSIAQTIGGKSVVTRFDPASVQLISQRQLPLDIKLPAGKLLEAKKWTDGNGLNILVIIRTAEQAGSAEAEDARHVELYARQYVLRSGRYQELWHLQDAVQDCIVDITLAPLPGSTTITDLDNDGKTETTLLYRLACRGDVSPAQLKLIMHEGPTKYALRGTMIQLLNHTAKAEQQRVLRKPICCADQVKSVKDEDYLLLEGMYQNEKEFATAPPVFLAYARQQWQNCRMKDTFE